MTTPSKYQHRLKSAVRENLTKEVVNAYTGFVFKQVPTRDGDERMKAFWANAQRPSGDIDDLMAQVCSGSAKTGRVAVIVDKSSAPAMTMAQDSQPYAYMIGACDILDYARDGQGRLLWILTRECDRDDSDPKVGTGDYKERYRLRTREGWELWEKDSVTHAAILIDQGEWGFKRPTVPVVLVNHEDSKNEYAPPGLIDEIVLLDRAIANEMTSLHEIVMGLGSPTLMFPGESDNPLSLGVSSVLTYSETASTAPSFLSMDGGYIEALQNRIDRMKSSVKELVSLPTQSPSQAAQSGESKKWDAQPLQAKLSRKVQNLQMAEIEIARIVDLFNGGDGNPEVSIQYPTTFDVTSLADDINQAPALAEMPGQYSLTYKAQLAKLIARKSMPDLDERTRKAIDDEIEANIAAGDRLPDDEDRVSGLE